MTEPRLYHPGPLAPGGEAALPEADAHYLRAVLRLGPGAAVRLFNAEAGEWRGVIAALDKRGGVVTMAAQTRPPARGLDLHLLFAPLKKTRTDFVVEKATELGASAIRPVFTRRTSAERVNTERLAALAKEAAEQSERLDLPVIAAPRELAAVLHAWDREDPGRRLLFADEGAAPPSSAWSDAVSAEVRPALDVLTEAAAAPLGPWAILIGPEGGFDPAERALLRAQPFVIPVGLGPRILRADTAAVVALALWGAVFGAR